ncbi:MAG: hypothetical protein DMF53_00540 [Acidobacteria bacterium]|nr:MAG: hypothetical protein DMF53_00540 [Acidobacteriota bacterium]
MKRQSTSGFVVQLNSRRLLLSCAVALVVLAFARPGLAQDLPDGKTAEQPSITTVATTATAATGLEANLDMAALSSPQSQGSCPFIKCWITCGNGLAQTLYFTNTFACYSYSDASGCRASGVFACSDAPPVAGC